VSVAHKESDSEIIKDREDVLFFKLIEAGRMASFLKDALYLVGQSERAIGIIQ
jgi:hypothetical protein